MNVKDLQAGRELDALVAEKVMGWYRVGTMWCKGANSFAAQADELDGVKPWAPSTDIAAAWEVASQFAYVYLYRTTSEGLTLMKPGEWECKFTEMEEKRRFYAVAESAPLAICRAALMAVAL